MAREIEFVSEKGEVYTYSTIMELQLDYFSSLTGPDIITWLNQWCNFGTSVFFEQIMQDIVCI